MQYLLKDSEFMIEDIDNYSSLYEDYHDNNDTWNDISYQGNFGYNYENFTSDNFSRKIIQENENLGSNDTLNTYYSSNSYNIKVMDKKWRNSMSLLESIKSSTLPYVNIGSNNNFIQENTINEIIFEEKVNFPLLLHTSMMLSQATYNLRLSTILDKIILDPKSSTLPTRFKDMIVLNTTLDNARLYLINMIKQSFGNIDEENMNKSVISMDIFTDSLYGQFTTSLTHITFLNTNILY